MLVYQLPIDSCYDWKCPPYPEDTVVLTTGYSGKLVPDVCDGKQPIATELATIPWFGWVCDEKE